MTDPTSSRPIDDDRLERAATETTTGDSTLEEGR
jgi:hypothetical protein